MYSPSRWRRGRDSIRVRLTSRSANSERQRTSQPGPDEPAPQNTSAVLKRSPGSGVGARPGDPHEARLAARVVLDVLAQHGAAVAVGRAAGPDRRGAGLEPARDLAHRVGGRPRGHHRHAGQRLPQEARALPARLRVRDDGADLAQLERPAGDEVQVHGPAQLADDHHVLGLEGDRVERRVDRALERVLDRHQRAVDGAVVDGDHRLVQRRLRGQLEAVRAGADIRASWLTVPSGPR